VQSNRLSICPQASNPDPISPAVRPADWLIPVIRACVASQADAHELVLSPSEWFSVASLRRHGADGERRLHLWMRGRTL